MSKNAIIGLLVVLVGIAGITWYAGVGRIEPAAMPTDVVSNEDDAAIRAAVVEFDSRADIVDVVSTGGSYVVHANIIETATSSSSGQAEPLGVQPVTLTVENRGGVWQITNVEKGTYSQLPQRQSVVGFWECLPKKGPGPHTMECAFGIAVDQSDGHLAVSTQLMSTYPVDFPTGTKVRVEGVVTPIQALSSDQWRSYDIDGIISATTITKVE